MLSRSYRKSGCRSSRSWPAPSRTMRSTPGSIASLTRPGMGCAVMVGAGDSVAAAGLVCSGGPAGTRTRMNTPNTTMAPTTASLATLNRETAANLDDRVDTARTIAIESIRRPGPAMSSNPEVSRRSKSLRSSISRAPAAYAPRDAPAGSGCPTD